MSSDEAPKIRVLLLAEECNPLWSSVPLVGYSLARALSERPDLDVTLATQVRNREAIEADPIAALATVAFIDTEDVAAPLFRLAKLLRGGTSLSWTTGMAMSWPSYMAFERRVFRQFAPRLRRGDFDVIHRITPVSPTLGSPLARLARPVPMVIGPLNGGLPWPKEYPGLRSKEREWLVPLRRLHRHLPYYRSTYTNAAAVVAGSRHTAAEVPPYFKGRRYLVAENAIDPARFPTEAARPEPGPRFRFVTVGRLVPYKGMDLIVEAMAGSPLLRECELEVVGDGPQRPLLESMVREAGLTDRVHFRGWLEHRDVAQAVGRAQAFVSPSLREFGGAVALEAMVMGLPAVVVAYGGPGELVTPECGVLLPMSPREQLVPALAAAMEALARDPALCRRMGDAARTRVLTHYTWPVKAGQMADIYREVLAARG